MMTEQEAGAIANEFLNGTRKEWSFHRVMLRDLTHWTREHRKQYIRLMQAQSRVPYSEWVKTQPLPNGQ
jgi:hypothetical protein